MYMIKKSRYRLHARMLFLTLCLAVSAFMISTERAEAFDPVTMMALYPVAQKALQVAGPYIIRGLKNAGSEMLSAGGELLNVFRLPLGVIQGTVLLPFGQLNNAGYNLVKGGIAPFKMCYHVVMAPIRLFTSF